ncbi:uncharacterized protein [Rutidosis leptorrhynchoides]|uniref:uncharacterized protein n=1 Tax=Rutidosis leptorrhynchoides TaxID=125765 RepID=UPI003A99FDDC
MECDYTSVRSNTKSMSPDSAANLFNVICAWSLLVLYNVTVLLLRLKYTGKEQTPFETHGLLMKTSIVAYFTTGMLSLIMFRNYLPFTNRKPLSPAASLFLKFVVIFLGVLAHLLLLMVLVAG